MKKESKAIVREATAFSLATYLFQFVSVIRGIVIAWFLGPALYGVWNIFKTFLETGNYVTAGSSLAVAREIPFNTAQGRQQENLLISRSTIGLCLLVSVLLALGALLFSCFEGAAGYRAEIRICAFAFVLNAINLYIPHQLKGEQKIFLLAGYYVAYALLNSLFGLALMLVWGIGGLLLGMMAANLVLIAYLLRARHMPRRITLRWHISRGLIGIGFPILFVAVAPKLMASLDKLIIFWLLDSTATGYYSMAAFFSETINYIPLALATVLFPRLMYQKGKGADLSKMGYLYDKPMVLLAWLIPILLGLLVLNIGLVIRYMLPDYLPALPVVQVLLGGLFFTVIWNVPRILLVVFDKQRVFLAAIPLLLLLGSALNIAAIKLGYGIAGVAYASVLFYFAVSTLANVYALRILQKSRRQIALTMLGIHVPFVYAVSVVLALQHYLNVDGELLQSVLRSVVFLVFCLPLMVYADRKLKLIASLRAALF
jgi:O-antigen/teichoic acid export membrane protein